MGGGGGWVCKPILVFDFGPNQALGLGFRLGPNRTKILFIIFILIEHLAYHSKSDSSTRQGMARFM